MSDPPLILPEEEIVPDPWEPVEDITSVDIGTPDEVPEEAPREDPFGPVADADPDDLPLPTPTEDDVRNPWSDAAEDEATSPTLAAPPPLLLPRTPPPRLLQPPSEPATIEPLPWRTPAELRVPTVARVLCEADARLARSRLLVAAWEWLEDDDEHVRFRLADDGEDVVVRVVSPGEAVVAAAFRVAHRDLSGELELVTDRDARGVRLGRDLLAGRFLVDPAHDAWA
ncbi:MAG: hypothetical protein KDA24_06420 [Deltaproteobacteria bacterium]|nr:hypothetical protein [Deltaproteobacteria bacterium]